MRRRAERLARNVAVAEKVWRLEQARLAQLDSELRALGDAQAAALQALGRLEPKPVLEHIAALARRRLELEAMRAEAQARTRDSGRRVKLAERLHADALERCRLSERNGQNGGASVR